MSKICRTGSKILHITLDTSTAVHLEESLTSGVFLAWEDALYEGPINAELNLADLSLARAKYFSVMGWVGYDKILSRYKARNEMLFSFQNYTEIVLWFDRDLNSQLQLVQIVDWFSHQAMKETRLSVISVERLSGISSYLGLGMLSAEGLQSVMNRRSEITLGQMQLSQQVWQALGSDNPNVLLNFCDENTSILPYLKNTLLRYLKQFPSQINGLSQTEMHISNVLSQKQRDANELYLAMQSKEGIPFMTRAMFVCSLQNMCKGDKPMVEQVLIPLDHAIEGENDEDLEEVVVEQEIQLKLTDLGKQVMHNWVDWVQVNGIQRWLGGVFLSEGNLWRYDQNKRKLIKTYV